MLGWTHTCREFANVYGNNDVEFEIARPLTCSLVVARNFILRLGTLGNYARKTLRGPLRTTLHCYTWKTLHRFL